MDIVTENFGAAVSKLLVEDAEGGPKSSDNPPPPAAASSIQSPVLPSSESSATTFSSPVHFEPHSLASGISVPITATVPPPDGRVADMSLAVVEPSTASMNFFSSSPVASAAPGSLSTDSPGVHLPPSSSALLDLSLAPANAFMTSPVSPAFSPSFTSVGPSVSLATPTPFSSSDMTQAPSETPPSTDSRSASLVSAPTSVDVAPQPVVPSVSARLNSSVILLTLPASLPPVEGPLPPPLKMPSSEEAAIAADTPSFSPVDVSKHTVSSVLPNTPALTVNLSTLPSSISQTPSRTESPPAAPSSLPEEVSAVSVPSELKLEMPTPSETVPLPVVNEALPIPPVGAPTEHERSSLETSTSFPSGTSTIASPSPSLIAELPTAFPSHSVCKITDPSSVSSSHQSPVTPGLEPSPLPLDPSVKHSMSTSCLALLSSVEVASSSSPLPALQMPSNAAASLDIPSSSSSGRLSLGSMKPESRVSTLPLAGPSSDFRSSRNLAASITVAPSIAPRSLESPFLISLNPPPHRDSTRADLPSGPDGGTPMDCSPSLNSHLRNVSSNAASSISDLSPSLRELRSAKEELSGDSGPPIAPTSEAFPRRPVRGGQRGEGWPYAPQGWPQRDDKWSWRVGKRVHPNGYFRDRFLGLPKALCKGRKVIEFASKKSVGEYVKQNFPDLSVERFFKSFQWRVPIVKFRNSNSAAAMKAKAVKRQRPAEEGTDDRNLSKRSKKECRAGNPKCGLETGRTLLVEDDISLPCDICCTEPGFCRECKCILCCKIIVPEAGECNFVRCLQNPLGAGTCGHAAHVECALHSDLAGVVKKRGLDMEYLCRRCDNKTDLRELVTLLLEAVGNTDQRTQAEKSLELALEVMKGTERGGSGARVLESLVKTALRKVQSGADIKEAFLELKDQGAAAEAARQQGLVRGVSLVDDTFQQPEASLDQWLPSSGSPSSHPSPGTPSSFTSPRMRSNPSVTSGQLIGTHVDGSGRKHSVGEGHTAKSGGPQTSSEIYSNSNYKTSHLGNKALIRNAGQARGTHRIRAVSSNANSSGLEAVSDSYIGRTSVNHAAEPSLRDGNSSQRAKHISNSGSKNEKDRRNPSGSVAIHKEDTVVTETCASCGTVRHHTSNPLEASSSRRFSRTDDGGKKVLQSRFTKREEEPGDSDNCKHVAESDTGVDQNCPRTSTLSANASCVKPVGSSLRLLDSQCEQDVQDALQKLRQSQEAEFERAKECLTAQRESSIRQYESLEALQSSFSEQWHVSSSLEAFDELMLKTSTQFAKAVQERENFKTMLKVGEGFGSFSRDDLKKLFRWPPEK